MYRPAAIALCALALAGCDEPDAGATADTPGNHAAREARCETGEATDGDARFLEQPLATDLAYAYAATIHDWDRDGRPDVIATDAERQNVHVFLNRGERRFERTVIAAPEVELMERNAIADLDGDGRPNLVVVDNLGDRVVWFDGDTPRTIGDVPRAYDVAVADLDGDGLVDVVASAYAGNLFRVFQHPGDARGEWPVETLASVGADTRTVRIADFNGDGRPDILGTARRSNRVVWFENPDWRAHVVDRSTAHPTHGHPADMDGDGDMDIVMAAGFHPGSPLPDERRCAHGVFWYENRGDRGPWLRHTVRMPFARAFEAVAADLDGDGDIDVAATAFGPEGRLAWFENSGDPRAPWVMHTIRDDWQDGTALAVGDIDGDGRPDLVSTQTGNSNNLHLWWNDTGGQN